MNTKIKFISIFLALILAFSLTVACKGVSEVSSTTEKTGVATIEKAIPNLNEVNVGYDGNRSLDFGEDWKFILVNPSGIKDPTGEYENVQDPAYNDSAWRTLDVPHDWSIELLPTTVPGTGTSFGTGYLQGGLG